jgi:hypothetical protein
MEIYLTRDGPKPPPNAIPLKTYHPIDLHIRCSEKDARDLYDAVSCTASNRAREFTRTSSQPTAASEALYALLAGVYYAYQKM